MWRKIYSYLVFALFLVINNCTFSNSKTENTVSGKRIKIYLKKDTNTWLVETRTVYKDSAVIIKYNYPESGDSSKLFYRLNKFGKKELEISYFNSKKRSSAIYKYDLHQNLTEILHYDEFDQLNRMEKFEMDSSHKIYQYMNLNFNNVYEFRSYDPAENININYYLLNNGKLSELLDYHQYVKVFMDSNFKDSILFNFKGKKVNQYRYHYNSIGKMIRSSTIFFSMNSNIDSIIKNVENPSKETIYYKNSKIETIITYFNSDGTISEIKKYIRSSTSDYFSEKLLCNYLYKYYDLK